MTDRARRGPALVAAALGTLAALGATACEPPPPPPPVLMVNSPHQEADAAPGDGICEIAEGTDECTLEAALDEAAALGDAVVSVDIETSGEIVFNSDDAEAAKKAGRKVILVRVETSPEDIHGMHAAEGILTATSFLFEQTRGPWPAVVADLTVAPGGSLVIDGIAMAESEASSLTIAGELVAHRTVLGAYGRPAVHITPTGSAFVASSFAISLGATPTFRNEGRLALQHITAWTDAGGPVLETAATGTTSLAATDLVDLSRPAGTLCTGSAPVSLGYNSATDPSCALTGLGDRQDAPVSYDWPGPDRVDAIPLGTLGCGAILGTDLVGAERPVDGDGDGDAACDIGAFEAQPAPVP